VGRMGRVEEVASLVAFVANRCADSAAELDLQVLGNNTLAR